MTRHLLIPFIFFLQSSISSFGQTNDSLQTRRGSGYVNKGPSISLGPECIFANRNLFGANINFRYWYRTGGTGHIRADNTINISAGLFRMQNENLFKFKVGDLILLKSTHPGDIRIGVFADYLVSNTTNIIAFDCSIGLHTPRLFIYIGGIQPILENQNDSRIKTGFSAGVDIYIFERKSFHCN